MCYLAGSQTDSRIRIQAKLNSVVICCPHEFHLALFFVILHKKKNFFAAEIMLNLVIRICVSGTVEEKGVERRNQETIKFIVMGMFTSSARILQHHEPSLESVTDTPVTPVWLEPSHSRSMSLSRAISRWVRRSSRGSLSQRRFSSATSYPTSDTFPSSIQVSFQPPILLLQ